MEKKNYSLPDISIIGGTTQNIRLKLRDCNGWEIDAASISAAFSLVQSLYKGSEPIISRGMEVVSGDNGKSEVAVTIEPKDTASLHGRFIYQITLIDAVGIAEVLQGCMNIFTNVDEEPLSNMPAPTGHIGTEFAALKDASGATYYPYVTEVVGGYEISWSTKPSATPPQNITLYNGVSPNVDDVAQRVLELLPKWDGGVF